MNSYKKYVIEKLTYMSGPRVALLFSSLLLGFGLMLFMGVSAAWSADFNATNVQKEFSVQRADTSSPGPDGSTCLPLLKSVHLPEKSVSGPTQRPAGKAAALGLILGLRYALAPAEEAEALHQQAIAEMTGSSPSDPRSQKDRSALAVKAWRQCQKDLALQNLKSYRWHR